MVIDMGSISALAVSLQSAGELVKMMMGLRDEAMIQAKVIELNGIILSAQAAALTANANQFTLADRVRDLEAEITKMKAWDAEKQRYKLADVGLGSLAYVLEPEAQGAEIPHAICVNCRNNQKISILQSEDEIAYHILRCPECKDRIRVKERDINL